jgi:hypothetical protein
MPSKLFLLAVANVAALGFCVVLFIYRIYFHPLSKIPGPLSNKLTGWPHSAATNSYYRHVWLHKLHQKYGMCGQKG